MYMCAHVCANVLLEAPNRQSCLPGKKWLLNQNFSCLTQAA